MRRRIAPTWPRPGDHRSGFATVELVNPTRSTGQRHAGEEHPATIVSSPYEIWYPAAEGTGAQGE